MYDRNAMQQYQATRVETGSKEDLIVMLYEGAIRFSREARQAMLDNNIADKGIFVNKATRVIHELSAALDHDVGGEVSQRLEALYEYIDFKLSYAHTTNETQSIDQAIHVMEILLKSWKQIAEGSVEEMEPAEKREEKQPLSSLSISV